MEYCSVCQPFQTRPWSSPGHIHVYHDIVRSEPEVSLCRFYVRVGVAVAFFVVPVGAGVAFLSVPVDVGVGAFVVTVGVGVFTVDAGFGLILMEVTIWLITVLPASNLAGAVLPYRV